MAASGGHWVKGSFQPAGGGAEAGGEVEYVYWDPENEELWDYEGPDPYDVADDAGLYISSNKDVTQVAMLNGEVVGAVFADSGWEEYEADIAVAPHAQGRGIGSRLLDGAIDDFRAEQGYGNEDMVFKAEVVNPRMAEMMARRGFEQTEDLGDRVLMELK